MITRFAPSPTGLLHLGHAFSALTAWGMAQAAGGRFLLRIEDIDRPRCRPIFEQAIYDDLHWIGLDWPEPPLRQSQNLPAYHAALARLERAGLAYPCSCTRADVRAALSAPQEGSIDVQAGPDGPIYPGTCRHRPMASRRPGDAIRLNMEKATALAGALRFLETGSTHAGEIPVTPEQLVETVGDVVLARKDIGSSYHLAVVVDDAAQDITHVVRGEDLYSATPIHVLLQNLLGLPTPVYHHHRLIRDEAGRRLAKRDDDRAIAHYRAAGAVPADIRRMVGL